MEVRFALPNLGSKRQDVEALKACAAKLFIQTTINYWRIDTSDDIIKLIVSITNLENLQKVLHALQDTFPHLIINKLATE